jgi:hypothetical protein
MQITGGLYHEQCCLPKWDCVFGSGGRAAAAISKMSDETTLHSYGNSENVKLVEFEQKFNLEIKLIYRPSIIVFSYFHPLSRPHIEPSLNTIKQEQPIHVEGESVLRFGFIEGEAVVDANKAVFDPQTWLRKPSFRLNGSKANELAIVLNELELSSFGVSSDIKKNAFQLMEEEQANVVVVKKGPRGAEVFESSGLSSHIPVFKSSRVFKIGTGDIFSAVFAHYWTEKRLLPKEAAYMASKAVAEYCNSGLLPIDKNKVTAFEPLNVTHSGTVLLLGKVNTLGNRFVLEEARFVLMDMGFKVICPALNSQNDNSATSILVLADTFSKDIEKQIYPYLSSVPIIILNQNTDISISKIKSLSNMTIVDDFTTAIYRSAWAASEINN